MPADTALNSPALTGGNGWSADLVVVAFATLGTLAIYAFGDFASLTNPNGDNDAVMRLVQVRDLIAGQGWFDLSQYRMGLEGGFQMHWSRLVDAPIAVLIVVATAVTGDQALGEAIAVTLWPQFLYAASLFLILRIARRFCGETALLPVLVIGAITLHFTGLFNPGAIDHHTSQLALTLGLLHFLLAKSDDHLAAIGAGSAAALMLAIGMESLPYVATGGLCAAALFLLRGEEEAGRAGRFGAAFAGASVGVFVLIVPPRAWLAPQCDAFSIAQTALATGAGIGLWSIAHLAGQKSTVATRAAWLAALGGILAATVLVVFPQCLADPYAALDPRLRTYWLDSVLEARSVVDLLASEPIEFAAYYATPLLGLVLLGVKLRRTDLPPQGFIVAGFLASAVLVSFWQVRGAMFSLPLAVIPLAAWVAELRDSAASARSPARGLKPLLAWLLSFNLVWYTAASAAEILLRPASSEDGETDESKPCYRAADYEQLAALPKGTVLGISNLGVSILAYTPHRALAGSYHRNVAGNLAALDALMGEPAEARRILKDAGVDFIAFCPNNKESRNLARWAPSGLEAALHRGEIPDWLEPTAGSETDPLWIYRVVE